jgi:hypothetical protein
MFLSPQEENAAPGRGEDLPGSVPLGTLCAELLDELEPTAELLQTIRMQLALRGQDVRSLAMTELSTRLLRFLQSSYVGRELSARRKGREILRGQPYDVAILAAPAAPRLAGILDLMVVDGEEASAALVQVLEYRYGYVPDDDSRSPLAQARRGLLRRVAQQVLLERQDGAQGALPPRTNMRVGTCYLRDADPQPRWEGPSSASGLDEVAGALVKAAPLLHLGPAAALRLPVLPLNDCRRLGCGYEFLCHAQKHP